MSDNKKLLVVIDPGHTGNTYNTGAVKGYYESKAVYDLSLYENTALEKRGIDVILTRERNQDPGEYSCAMKSHFRKFGNQMSGSGNHLCNYASLLA